jgi:anti-sigma B factor antagonist
MVAGFEGLPDVRSLGSRGWREWSPPLPDGSLDTGWLAVDISSRPIADGLVLIAVAGEIDMATVDDLSEAMHSAVLQEGTTDVVLDFANVTFCDSSGFAALDAAYAEGSRRGTALRLINVQPQIRRLLEIVGMLDTLTRPDGPDR